jgi:iron(III) transport system ATP-binding protein
LTRTTAGIRIENLHVSFGPTKVLEGIDMEILPGEFFAFLGPSGSGKSTLLRAIAGFGPRPKGRILIGERDIADLPPWKRDVGMVFQSYALWPHMTVRANVAFGLQERRIPRREIGSKVRAALDLVGLADMADRMPSQLSGGQQQRVALARTVAIEPQVLLLDEPLSNLDASLRVQMRRELLALQRQLKLTTVFVTHDQEEANTTSDRMAVLDGGVIQQIGTPQDLYDHPANVFVAGFLGTANILKGRLADGNFLTASGHLLPISKPVPGASRAPPPNVLLWGRGEPHAATRRARPR